MGFFRSHQHSLMSAAVFTALVVLNVIHQASPTLDGVAAILMAGLHFDGYASKYLAANSNRAETISNLANSIFAGITAWQESQHRQHVDQTPTAREMKAAKPSTETP